ncbi:MAG: RNA polymerase sigma factor [Saprospiraceae bacterium]|nr:RNA polymerase sigma factor [Saprospiraceae bacterium]
MNRTWADNALVQAIQSGGAMRDEALKWWFQNQELRIWVIQYALRHGGDRQDGEDLYHDTFLSFDRLLRTGKYRGESSLKTFFIGIAKWQWLNQQRKMGRTISLEADEKFMLERFSEDDMFVKERQALFEMLLAKIGERCKRLLTMYKLNFSMKEIAAEMGYATDQVAMNQCAECRKKLKHLIENDHELLDVLQN